MAEPEDTQELRTTQVITSGEIRRHLSAARQTPAALVLLIGPAAQMGRQWELRAAQTHIGRDERCDIVVLDRSVSSRHARIVRTDTATYLEDLASTNGTLVDQQRLRPGRRVPLRDNDQIVLGNVVFKYLAAGNLELLKNKVAYDRASIDPLTEIFNRRGLMEQAQEVVKRAQAARMPVTAVVFDIDDFKNINDSCGHQCGDYVLKELARVVRTRLIREGDLFARFGGEEFCLLLSATELEQGAAIAERVRAAIEGHSFRYGDRILKVTASLGVASLTTGMQNWQQLFAVADEAAYTSKRNGKNQVTLSR